MAGSAVCAYDMEAFEEAFNGPFKHQKDSMSAWMRHENGQSEARVSLRTRSSLHTPFYGNRLVGLVVKASASRAARLGSILALPEGLYPGRVIPGT